MINIDLINPNDSELALKSLEKYYQDRMIPAEKKTYLTDLRESKGPYMGICSQATSKKETHYLLDAASQIATLGLGFNHPVFFGTAHHLDSWTNNKESENFKHTRKAIQSFFKRTLGWDKLNTTLCNSGAEANEIALGYCFEKRKNKAAKKVLAFEGSFHGRMLVALSSTWNPVKREPFEWEDYKTIYSPFPKMDDDNYIKPIPEGWLSFWENESILENPETPTSWKEDPLLKNEFECLIHVRDNILKNKIFAIIIEPMQCEGGDQFGTNRFYNGLCLLAKTFQIPIIFDEVQTGFHLGKEFFWHNSFQLKDSKGIALYPDYVTCAKKAQVGMVFAHENETDKYEEFSVASAIRGYHHGVALDQAHDLILKVEDLAKSKLVELTKSFPENLENPRCAGISFAFDLKDKSLISKMIEKRFNYGLLFYPAGSNTLRFRLNLGFSESDIDLLFSRLNSICGEVFKNIPATINNKIQTKPRGTDNLYEWHQFLLETNLNNLLGTKVAQDDFDKRLNKCLEFEDGLILRPFNKENFDELKDKIVLLQKKVYEPTRLTDIEEFKKVVISEDGIAIGIFDGNNLAGIAFSDSLELNPLERGVRIDSNFKDPKSFYMLDVTIDPEYGGRGLGRKLKYALTLFAKTKDINRINGRNRAYMAKEMMAINLSLGAVEENYIREDYPDFEKSRDVFYYTNNNRWSKSPINLSSAIESPLGPEDLSKEYIEEQLPFLINKVCLSNFVSERFLSNLKDIFHYLPENLRHGYSTSGQSECVDKLVKIIWHKVKHTDEIKHKNKKMLTFKGSFFGNGSFLSRSLSNEKDGFFPTTHLKAPNKDNYQQVLGDVEKELKKNEYMSVWIEPVAQKSMNKVPKEFLLSLRKLCDEFTVPLVFNETASAFCRFSEKDFFTSNIPEISPDLGMCFLGGQAGIVFTKDYYFLEKPLMLISTWDGDEFSFANFIKAAENFKMNKGNFDETRNKFEKKLKSVLEKVPGCHYELSNGCGWIEGTLPQNLRKLMKEVENRFLIFPSWSEMKRYLND